MHTNCQGNHKTRRELTDAGESFDYNHPHPIPKGKKKKGSRIRKPC